MNFVQRSLNCTWVETTPIKPYLSLNNNLLAFHSPNFKKPLSFDPAKGKIGFRLQRFEQEGLLKKALGNLKPGSVILDATAGLLSDSLILSSLGYSVIAIEQSSVIGTMLQVGMKTNSEISGIKLCIGRAEKFANELRYDAIYYDPMFESSGSALGDKNLRMLQEILTLENIANDNHYTFNELRKCSYQKLIVKRPIKSSAFDENINYQIRGKAVRYDVYI